MCSCLWTGILPRGHDGVFPTSYVQDVHMHGSSMPENLTGSLQLLVGSVMGYVEILGKWSNSSFSNQTTFLDGRMYCLSR